MDLEEGDDDHGRGAHGGGPDGASDYEMEDDDQGHEAQGGDSGEASDQEMEDGDTIQVAASGKIESIKGSLVPDSPALVPDSPALVPDSPALGPDSPALGPTTIHYRAIRNRSVTPLFVSSRDPSSGSEASMRSESSLRQSMDLPEGATFAVLAPPVRRRWEYQTLDDDPRVTSILQEQDKAGVIIYAVESRDRRVLRVS